MDPISAGIAAVGSIAGSALTGKLNRKAQIRDQNHQRAMMNEQNALNVENWERANAYNSDVSQVARRRAAGLNPVTIDGASNAGTISAATAPSTPRAHPAPDFSAAVTRSLEAIRAQAEVRVADSVANRNDAEADAIRGETDPVRTDMSLKQSVISLNSATEDLTRSHALSEDVRRDVLSIDRDIRGLDRATAQIDYQAKSGSFTVDLDGRSVNLTDATAQLLVKAFSVENAFNESAATRSRRYSAASRAAIDANEASNWSTSFITTMQALRAKIRDTNGSAALKEFDNRVNSSVESVVKQRRSHEEWYNSELYRNLFGEEKSGSGTLGRSIQRISPFSGFGAQKFGK